MHRLTIGSIVLVCCSILGAETFEARGVRYALTIDAVPETDSVTVYDVRVTELATNAVTVFPPIRAERNKRGEAVARSGSTSMKLLLASLREALTASVEIRDGERVIDSIRAVWRTDPPTLRFQTEGALRVGGDVRPPVVISRVEPLYTEEARAARIAGIVILEALVDKNGVLRDAVVLKDLPYGLGQSALDAVQQWQFEPGTRDGEPVDVLFNLTVNFKIAGVPPQ